MGVVATVVFIVEQSVASNPWIFDLFFVSIAEKTLFISSLQRTGLPEK